MFARIFGLQLYSMSTKHSVYFCYVCSYINVRRKRLDLICYSAADGCESFYEDRERNSISRLFFHVKFSLTNSLQFHFYSPSSHQKVVTDRQ